MAVGNLESGKRGYPLGLPFELFNYQVYGIKWLMEPVRARYLADWPGLGKTIQSIVAARLLGVKAVLAMCPAAVVPQWQKSLAGFSRPTVVSYESLALASPRKHRAECPRSKENRPLSIDPDQKTVCLGCGFVYESTDMLARRTKAKLLRRKLKDLAPWDLIICDEAHLLKERGSNRTGYIMRPSTGIIAGGKKVFLLSGTPILNRPAELYPILRACYPEAVADCQTWESYAYKFCGGEAGWHGTLEANGASNIDILGERLKPFMLHRDFNVLGDRLPPIEVLDRDVVLHQTICKDDHIATRRRLTGEAKIELLMEDIGKMASLHGKLIVFYQHRSVKSAIKRAFPHALVIQGGMSAIAKKHEIERFRRLPQADIIAVQLGAGGVGVDGLQFCTSAGYLAELDWTPALMDQAMGRIWRIGQKDPVTFYRPIGRNQGTDGTMTKMLDSKNNLIEDVMSYVKNNEAVASIEEIIHWVNNCEVFMSDSSMSNELISGQLERIAGAVETLCEILAGSAAPAQPARTRKGGKAAAVEAVPAPEVTQPEDPGMTADQLRDKLNAEMFAVAGQEEARYNKVMALLTQFGAKTLDDVKPDDREGFSEAAIAAMTTPDAEAPKAGFKL